MSNDFYQKFDDESHGVRSNFILPFVSGVLGASLVVGLCFGIPSIKNKLISNGKIQETSSNITTVSGNTTQISLTNYSDTAVYAAKKSLPSIAKISISYNVSFLGRTRRSKGIWFWDSN